MNPIQTQQPLDPVAFATWVRQVAAINEQFSETLRDTADMVAIIDPPSAIPLYQAADKAIDAVQRLRQATIKAMPPKPASTVLVSVGFVCGVLLSWLCQKF